MREFVDMHVHLLAGLDDGPKTQDDAVEMARILVAEGAVASVALAHQNPGYPEVTPDRIRNAFQEYRTVLQHAAIPLEVFPCAEVMVQPELEEQWFDGKLMTVADRKQWLLLEMPHRVFVDLRPFAAKLREVGIRIIVAHAERSPELLHEPGHIEELIRLGCLVQISSSSVSHPAQSRDEKALRDWFRRGIVHLLGSDGHSIQRRPPKLALAAAKIQKWVGEKEADRICRANGLAILRGQPVLVPPPAPLARSWFAKLWS